MLDNRLDADKEARSELHLWYPTKQLFRASLQNFTHSGSLLRCHRRSGTLNTPRKTGWGMFRVQGRGGGWRLRGDERKRHVLDVRQTKHGAAARGKKPLPRMTGLVGTHAATLTWCAPQKPCVYLWLSLNKLKWALRNEITANGR